MSNSSKNLNSIVRLLTTIYKEHIYIIIIIIMSYVIISSQISERYICITFFMQRFAIHEKLSHESGNTEI